MTDEERIGRLILAAIADEFLLTAALSGDVRQMEAMKLFKEILENLPVQAS